MVPLPSDIFPELCWTGIHHAGVPLVYLTRIVSGTKKYTHCIAGNFSYGKNFVIFPIECQLTKISSCKIFCMQTIIPPVSYIFLVTQKLSVHFSLKMSIIKTHNHGNTAVGMNYQQWYNIVTGHTIIACCNSWRYCQVKCYVQSICNPTLILTTYAI